MVVAGGTIIALEWTMLVVTSIFVAVRLYARAIGRQRRNFPWGWSDLFVVLGFLSFVLQAAMDTVLNRFGLFKPGIATWEPEASKAKLRNPELVLKIYYVENVTYLNCMYCVKAAMLCLFHEFFPRFMRKTWAALIFTDVLVALTFLTGLLMDIFYCMPVKRNWSMDSSTYCSSFDQPVVIGFVIGSHIATDLIVYFLPLIVIRTLTLPRWQKVGIGIAFALGFLCVFFGVANLVTTYVRNPTFGTQYTFSIFEQTWALIVVCVPSIRTVLLRMGMWKDGTIKSQTAGQYQSDEQVLAELTGASANRTRSERERKSQNPRPTSSHSGGYRHDTLAGSTIVDRSSIDPSHKHSLG